VIEATSVYSKKFLENRNVRREDNEQIINLRYQFRAISYIYIYIYIFDITHLSPSFYSSLCDISTDLIQKIVIASAAYN
jgi:hypothetical protein